MPQPPSLTGVPDDPLRNLPNPESYDTSDPDVVVDEVTHLVWQTAVSPDALTQSDAQSLCAGLELGGRTDWRLPSRIELVSLINVTVGRFGNIDLTTFPDSPVDVFWTCSSGPANPLAGWVVDFTDGITSIDDRITDPHRVRCVAGTATSTPPPARYDTSTPNQVRDLKTLLTWAVAVPDSGTWGEAYEFCAGLGAGWRLPSLTELQTLIDESEDKMGVDATAFPDRPDVSYWTSSSYDNAPDQAYVVSIGAGNTTYTETTSVHSLRCVR